jgi:hypothetical protein
MLPGDRFSLEHTPATIRRRLHGRDTRSRADRFTPPDWPRSRGPTPNPRTK